MTFRLRISLLVTNRVNITIAINYKVACGVSASIFIFDLLKVNLAVRMMLRQICWPSFILFATDEKIN